MTAEDRRSLLDVLWKLYAENTIHGRHHETQRSTATNLILVLAAAVLTLTTVDKAWNPADVPAAAFVIVLGLFGAVFSAQHYARYRRHMERAKHCRIAMDRLLPQLNDPDLAPLEVQVRRELGVDLDRDELAPGVLTVVKRAGDHAFDRKPASILGSVTPGGLHALWIALHFIVVALGTFLVIVALWWPRTWG